MQPISTLPKAEAPRLPCPAHAPGYGEDRRAVVPSEARRRARTPKPPRASSRRRIEADRAFHAMLARLTGGISPVALSLAYIDWASHLAAAPQRQMEIVAGRLAERESVSRSCAALFLARSGTLVPDQAAAAGSALCQAGVGNSAVQSARAGVSAERAMVAQRDHRRARRGAAERGDRRVLGAAGARYAGAVQFRRDQSRSAAEGVPERRREFRIRLAELVQRLDAPAVRRQAAGRRSAISSSAKPSRRRAARSCSATN